ncbi:hypothetical protein AB0J83_46450 [Actinoplanes sp. NPDC049596]|uniref:hypothetical protein n=1 Tax=unclassified Actinoplanes TaxID=2626549 RepID=UPI003446BD97
MSNIAPVPVLIVTHGPHSRPLVDALTRFRPAGGAELEISAIHSVAPDRMDPGVRALARQTIQRTRPPVVVEAVDDPVISADLAVHAIRHGASVVTMSATLISGAQRLHQLAADHGVGFYTEAALQFDLPIGALLRTSLPGDHLRSVNAFLPRAPMDEAAMTALTHRAAALATTAFRWPTAGRDVTVEESPDPPGDLRPAWERRLVLGVTRTAGTLHTEVFHALLPPTHPIAAARVRSGFMVEAAAAGTLVFTCSHRSSSINEAALHSDLEMATRAAVGPQPPAGTVRLEGALPARRSPVPYLVSCATVRPADVHAVITALDHPDTAIRELENDKRSLRMVVHAPSRHRIHTALEPLAADRVDIERLQVTGAGAPSTWLSL